MFYFIIVFNNDEIKQNYNKFVSKLKQINKSNYSNVVFDKYLFILIYLLNVEIKEQNMELSYLFNQNVLYYYKLINPKVYLMNGINNLFLYVNKNNVKAIKIINNDKYYKSLFYYTPFNKNGIKQFLIKNLKTNEFNISDNKVFNKLIKDDNYKILNKNIK